MRMYVNDIKNRIPFKIKTGYYVELNALSNIIMYYASINRKVIK